jgi:LysB family phage lysis regulatory protein
MTWKLALKAVPFIAIALLIGLVLWQRNSITAAEATAEAQKVRIEDLNKANASLDATVKDFAAQRVANDKIFGDLLAAVGGNETRLVETRTIIEKAIANDPVVRAWYDTPVPDSVREALRARAVDPASR